MVVIVKPLSEYKPDKPVEKPVVVNVDGVGVECVGVECDRLNVDGAANPHMGGPVTLRNRDSSGSLWDSSDHAKRQRRCMKIGTFFFVVVMLSLPILYNVIFSENRQSARFRGWCGVPLNSRIGKWPTSSDGVLNEEFELDLGSDALEEIYVPDFGNGREGKFIHDFFMSKTAIVDSKDHRCFVFPLERSQVVSPRELFRILQKMWRGFYEGNMMIVRQTMRVVRPPIEDFSETGRVIENRCKNFTTYRMEKIYLPHDGNRPRRSLDKDHSQEVANDSKELSGEQKENSPSKPESQTEQEHDEYASTSTENEPAELPVALPFKKSKTHFTLAEFAGKMIIEYTILDE